MTDLNWKKASRRRTWFSRVLSLSLITATTTVMYFFFIMYHYPMWVTIPFLFAYFLLGYLGMTYFWASFFGFYISTRKHDQYDPENFSLDLPQERKVAVLLPVYQEDARRFGAALAAMVEDLERNFPAYVKHFDFFVLSDSRKIDNVVQEEWAVTLLMEQFPNVNFVYRHRAVNAHAKQGNVSDFIRRWGMNYSYMLMLDADSIVPADTMVRMARILEGNHRIGIVQANLSMVFRQTLYARISRYISALTLKLGLFGQYFTQMGYGYYYGHNAMLRVVPFLENCGLPVLPQKGPFQSGKPLSHDYVEAALMAGAGYEVWILPKLDSFEELPTNLIDDMQREMRWMVGSLMYLRVFHTQRINPTFKLRLFTSAINYLTPILGWIFFFLALFGMRYVFSHPLITYSIMTRYWPFFAFSLGFLVLSIFVRWLLPTLYFYKTGKLHLFGGFVKSTFSYLIYTLYGLVMGPIYMAQLTRMLHAFAKGRKIHWGEQNREDSSVPWSQAINQFGWMTVLGLVFLWLVVWVVFALDTSTVQSELGIPKWGLLFWYVPLLSGLIFSPVIVRFFSRRYLPVEKMGWFLSPTDVETPFVLSQTLKWMSDFSKKIPEDIDFIAAIRHPWFYHYHRKAISDRPEKFLFWQDRLEGKTLSQLNMREKFVVYRNRMLWGMFHETAFLADHNKDLILMKK